MPSIINLSHIWEHTLTEILNHGNKTEVGIIMRSWVKDNNLEEIKLYDLNDFTPTGSLSQYKVSAEAEETKPMPITPLKELYNLIGIFNTSFLNPNLNMMMRNLTTLLMRLIGYCKHEENI